MSIGRHVVEIQVAGQFQGYGVVVADGLVLTAARCLGPLLENESRVSMMFEDASSAQRNLARIKRPDGGEARAIAVFIDVVSDLASLQIESDSPSGNVAPMQVDFSCWNARARQPSVVLSRVFVPGFGEIPISWFWFEGMGAAMYVANQSIPDRAAGCPIVTPDGRLIGVVSRFRGTHASETND